MPAILRSRTSWQIKAMPGTSFFLQLQQMARGLKFRIKKVEGLYYICSENKGADREADLRLCFRICKMLVFS